MRICERTGEWELNVCKYTWICLGFVVVGGETKGLDREAWNHIGILGTEIHAKKEKVDKLEIEGSLMVTELKMFTSNF